MATYAHTLTFTAGSTGEYAAMKTWVNGAGAGTMTAYTVTWDDTLKKLSLTYTGTRSTDWSAG